MRYLPNCWGNVSIHRKFNDMATDNIQMSFKTEGFRETIKSLRRLQQALMKIGKLIHRRKRLFQHKDRLHRLRKRQTNQVRARFHFNAYSSMIDMAIALSRPIPKYPKGSADIGGTAIIGERGPEIINRGERIFPVYSKELTPLPPNAQIVREGVFNWKLPPGALMPRDKIKQN